MGMPMRGTPIVWNLLPEVTASTIAMISVRKFLNCLNLGKRTRRLSPECLPSIMKGHRALCRFHENHNRADWYERDRIGSVTVGSCDERNWPSNVACGRTG